MFYLLKNVFKIIRFVDFYIENVRIHVCLVTGVNVNFKINHFGVLITKPVPKAEEYYKT